MKTNSFYKLGFIELPIRSHPDKCWWDTYYPNARNFILSNNSDVYTSDKTNYTLKDLEFVNDKYEQGHSLIIDKNKYNYGLLCFDNNLIKKSCYFCVLPHKSIKFLDEGIRNQILNYLLLQ